MRTRTALAIVLGLLLCLSATTAAHAHAIHVFAVAQGKAVRGEVYMSGGARPAGCKIEVFAPDGTKVAETVTNDRGEFSFEAAGRADHRIVADTGDGHRAEYVLRADELPETLPSGATGPHWPAGATHEDARISGEAATEPRGVEQIIARHIGALRQELREARDRRRLSDVLGGIGYIFGLAGVGLYFRSRGRRRPPREEEGS